MTAQEAEKETTSEGGSVGGDSNDRTLLLPPFVILAAFLPQTGICEPQVHSVGCSPSIKILSGDRREGASLR